MNTCIHHTDKERVEAAGMCVVCLIAGIRENAIRERETEIRARDFELLLARVLRALNRQDNSEDVRKLYDQAQDFIARKGTASPLRHNVEVSDGSEPSVTLKSKPA